ncbi:hypothetical protein SDC9_209211 [bioreactor metagenome]|uniref:Nucleotidyl transferase domain-containing protein n=1 Tax=bioreactor metagenome TaxID=1076179 RepID=A0A645JMC1_9ZZZZ
MVGFTLRNTLSEFGFVSRGICMKNAEGFLTEVNERTHIVPVSGGRAEYKDDNGSVHPLTGDEIASMNFWGFSPWIFEKMEEYFHAFLHGLSAEEQKAECLLPSMVDELIAKQELRVDVLSSDAVWFGVTYREDRDIVASALANLHECGKYPSSLRE